MIDADADTSANTSGVGVNGRVTKTIFDTIIHGCHVRAEFHGGSDFKMVESRTNRPSFRDQPY